MERASWRQRFAPWAGLVGGALAWSLHHQVSSDALHFGCDTEVGPLAVAGGVLALFVALAGGWMSWRASGADAPSGHRFVGRMTALCAGIFALVIAMQIIASLLVPTCAR
jgi:protein-S-isoprenylcysteine O-methyltransferase Ste14